MADRWWVGDLTDSIKDNNWENPYNWATIEGGGGGAGVPTAADDVKFSAKSSNEDCVMTATVNAKSIATSSVDTGGTNDYTGHLDANDQDVNVAGDVYLEAPGTVSMGSGTWTISGDFTFVDTGMTLNYETSKVIMNGAGKVIAGSWHNELYEVQISANISVGPTCAARTEINGNLTVDAGSTLTITNEEFMVNYTGEIYCNGTITGTDQLVSSSADIIMGAAGVMSISTVSCRNTTFDNTAGGNYSPTTTTSAQDSNFTGGTFGGAWTFSQEANADREVTFNGNTTFTGACTFDQNAAGSDYELIGNANDVEFQSTVTFNQSGGGTFTWTPGAGTWTFGDDYDPRNFTNYNWTSSTVKMNGANKTIWNPSVQSHGNVIIANDTDTGNSVTAKGLTTVEANQTLTISAGHQYRVDSSAS